MHAKGENGRILWKDEMGGVRYYYFGGGSPKGPFGWLASLAVLALLGFFFLPLLGVVFLGILGVVLVFGLIRAVKGFLSGGTDEGYQSAAGSRSAAEPEATAALPVACRKDLVVKDAVILGEKPRKTRQEAQSER